MQEEEDDMELMAITRFFQQNRSTSQLFKWYNERLVWKDHMARERHTGGFQSKYHISERAWKPFLSVDLNLCDAEVNS